MTKLMRFLVINTLIGIVIYFAVMMVLDEMMKKKYPAHEIRNSMDDLTSISDMNYESKFGSVEKGRFLSWMLTFALWEIMVPFECWVVISLMKKNTEKERDP
jgi:hypothetical protein